MNQYLTEMALAKIVQIMEFAHENALKIEEVSIPRKLFNTLKVDIDSKILFVPDKEAFFYHHKYGRCIISPEE